MAEGKGTTGRSLKIWVHFGLTKKAAGSVDAVDVDTLRKAIKATFSDDVRKFAALDKLIVQTKDADNNLHLLDDAELVLDEVLKETDGKYRVYVKADAAAGTVQVDRPPDGTVPNKRIQFWQSLFAATLMQGKGDPFHYLTLSLHYGTSNLVEDLQFEGKPSNQLIVRNCYEPLFRRIMDELLAGRKVFVTGTPGVGKTMFRNYVAWSLLLHFNKQPVAIAMVKGDSDNIDVMCWDGENFCVEYWQNVVALCRKFEHNYVLGKNAFFLADVSDGKVRVTQQIPKGLVVFTSPNELAWKEQLKQDSVQLLMPLWKQEELLARRSSVPGVDFGERFIKYGGLVRAVWGSDATLRQLENKLRAPVESATIKSLREHYFPKVMHKFVYLNVAENKEGDYRFDVDLSEPNPNPSLGIGTRYIARLIARSWVKNLVDKINSQFFATAPPLVAGLMFEAVALELLLNYSQTATFSIRSLRLDPPAALFKLCTAGDWRKHGNLTGTFHPKPPTLVEFNNEDDVLAAVDTPLAADGAVVLAIPRSTTFAGIDGIYAWKEGTQKNALLLQVTRSRDHELGNGWAKVLAAFSAFQLCIGYLVDPAIFDTYQDQGLRDSKNSELFLETPQICLKAVAPVSFEDNDSLPETAAKKLKHIDA